MREGLTREATPLCCEARGREQCKGEHGWRGMLDREVDDQVIVVIVCPDCHGREFEQHG